MDLTVEGKLYIHGAFEQGCIGVQDGKIVAIKKTLKSDNHLDFGAHLILPAGIDMHVHFRDPGFPQKEDFSSGSLAAAFGGISCVFDMPNTQPLTTTVQALQDKKHTASIKSHVDFGLYAGVTNENLGRVAELAPYCNGFKIFLGSSTNTSHLNSSHLRVAFLETNRTKKPTLLHAEDEHCLRKHQGAEKNLVDHVRCRPAGCEETAIRDIINASESLSSPIHICHLSSCEGFELLRRRPANLSVGVTPHHLFFDVNMISSQQSWYKVNPPIRSSFDKETLWYAVKSGLIDVFESDHAPHTLAEKAGDFQNAPCGMPGVETMYPLLLAAVKKDILSLDTLLGMLCERPAQLLGIPKGKIEVGYDADFIVVDLKKPAPIQMTNLHSACGWTPYEGQPAVFPSSVFVRGERLIEDRMMLQKPGCGHPIGV